jgi:HK97 family phage portal protein
MPFDLDRALAGQKALPAHPALMDRSTPVSVYSPGAARQDAVISQREAMRHLQAYGGDQAMDYVYDCVGLYADPASTAPYRLEKEDGTKLVEKRTDGTPPEYEEGPSDLYRLLNAPNPLMLYDELMSLLVIDLLLVGNAYWLKWRSTSEGKPLALYRLAPGYVKIKPGPYGPKKYEYQPPGAKDPLKLDPSDIIHFRRPNPHSAYYGMGVIQGAGRAMDLELSLVDTMASYFENRADPSLIVQSDRRVPRDVFHKLRAQLRSRLAGSKRAGELLVLEAGLKASSLSASAREAMFDELSKSSRDRIFTKFRASPMLFGLMDEAAGSNKVSDARREFDNSALRPFLDRLQRQITASLAAAWECEFIIDHRSILPAEEALKVGESVARVPGVKVREVRRMYAQFGIEESTGDPEIDNLVINVPGVDMDENGQPLVGDAAIADQPLGSEAGRRPKPSNTRAFGVAGAKVQRPQGKSLPEIEAALDALVKASGKALNQAGERVTVGNRLPDEQRPSDDFAAARRVDIDAAMGFITAGLRDASVQLERDLLDHVEGKALKTSDIVGRIRKSDAWAKFKENVQRVLEDGARQAVISGVMHSGRTPEDEIDYDAIVQSVVHRPEGLRGIIKTIRDRVVARIKETRDADGERTDYEAAVRAVVSQWADSQAVTIADSEATEAYNEAVLTTLEADGEAQVYVTDGDEDDEPCIEANGQVWTIEKARANRKEHPRCRRAFLPIAEVA